MFSKPYFTYALHHRPYLHYILPKPYTLHLTFTIFYLHFFSPPAVDTVEYLVRNPVHNFYSHALCIIAVDAKELGTFMKIFIILSDIVTEFGQYDYWFFVSTYSFSCQRERKLA